MSEKINPAPASSALGDAEKGAEASQTESPDQQSCPEKPVEPSEWIVGANGLGMSVSVHGSLLC